MLFDELLRILHMVWNPGCEIHSILLNYDMRQSCYFTLKIFIFKDILNIWK